jgi:hypothetical protein
MIAHFDLFSIKGKAGATAPALLCVLEDVT